MVTLNPWKDKSNEHPKEVLSTDEYLASFGLTDDALSILEDSVQEQENDSTEAFLERHGVGKDGLGLRTEEGRKGAELLDRLQGRKLLLRMLLVPMVVIPFWFMWILSPPNTRHYSERMQGAFLGAFATNVLGLAVIVARDLFSNGKDSHGKESKPEDEHSEKG